MRSITEKDLIRAWTDSQDEIAVELNSGSALAEAGQWNQFAVVRNGDTFILYLNGMKAAEETKAGIDQTGTPYASWFGGYNNNAGGEPTAQFMGVMDEIVFYNTPITDVKVKDLYDEYAETEAVSKNTLEYFLNSAKEYVANGDVDSCVESVRKLFEEAIAEGEAVMADENATRDEVMNAAMKLIKAIHALEMKAADKTDLEMAVELGDMIDLSRYVEAGQQEFTDALASAKEVLADGDALQGDVDAAWDALVTAMENLRLKADKDALEDLLDEVSVIDLSQYTEESAAVFRTALASAQAVFADETLSEDDQQAVDDAVAALKEAKDGLAAKADGSEDENEDGQNQGDGNQGGNGGNTSGTDNTGNTGNADKDNGNTVDKAAKTGDAVPIMAMLMLVLVSGAAALTVYRKRTR